MIIIAIFSLLVGILIGNYTYKKKYQLIASPYIMESINNYRERFKGDKIYISIDLYPRGNEEFSIRHEEDKSTIVTHNFDNWYEFANHLDFYMYESSDDRGQSN